VWCALRTACDRSECSSIWFPANYAHHICIRYPKKIYPNLYTVWKNTQISTRIIEYGTLLSECNQGGRWEFSPDLVIFLSFDPTFLRFTQDIWPIFMRVLSWYAFNDTLVMKCGYHRSLNIQLLWQLSFTNLWWFYFLLDLGEFLAPYRGHEERIYMYGVGNVGTLYIYIYIYIYI